MIAPWHLMMCCIWALFIREILSDEAEAARHFVQMVSSRNLRDFSQLVRPGRLERRRGVVYAAIGVSTIQKASASCQSVIGNLGSLAVTSDEGLTFLQPWFEARGADFWFDRVVSLDGDFLRGLPEFEAFTALRDKESDEKRLERKSLSWSAIRRLRTAKIAALVLATRLFEQSALFLDSDTLACAPLDAALATVGPDVPIAFVPAPFSHHVDILDTVYGVSGDPPEPNTGVLALDTSAALPLLREWASVYWSESLHLSSRQNPMDQPPLRVAMHKLGTKWAQLEPMWNCRGKLKLLSTAMPMICGGLDKSTLHALLRFKIDKADAKLRATKAQYSRFERAQTKGDCAVIHSHELPKPMPQPWRASVNLRQSTVVISLVDLTGTTGVDHPSPLVANFGQASDWRRLADHTSSSAAAFEVASGDFALEACHLVERCAVVLLVDEPWQRHMRKAPYSMLEYLVPLWPQDLLHDDNPRADRIRRLGRTNLAVSVFHVLLA